MGHNEDIVFTWRGVYDVLCRIGNEGFGAIYVKTPLNLVNAF